MDHGNASDYRQVALEFAKALATRQYASAYAMTSREYQQESTLDQLRANFEAIVPSDWGAADPIEVGQTMTEWPGLRPSDLGWVYVSIGGEVYSEALTVVVTLDDGAARIRAVEFGRP